MIELWLCLIHLDWLLLGYVAMRIHANAAVSQVCVWAAV
jgi:hypothetical protein